MNCCRKCFRELTFKSEKKKKYIYCKSCFCKLVKLGTARCRCKMGFRRKCHYFSLCGNESMYCEACGSSWIDEYCWPCR